MVAPPQLAHVADNEPAATLHRQVAFAILAAELGDADEALDRAGAIVDEHARTEAFDGIAQTMSSQTDRDDATSNAQPVEPL